MISQKPYQYIKGWVEFYKLKFKVTPDVLIPRPETELLVDEALSYYTLYPTPYTLIDIGTGCGNIAISLAKNLRLHPWGVNVNIIATDISAKALKVAKQNAKLHKVDKRILFLESDLLSVFCHPERSEGSLANASTHSNKLRDSSLITQNDNLIIVTNLPYIPSERIPYLDTSVKDFEPLVALDGGEDGFALYRKLFQQISKRMHKPGLESKLQTGFGKLKLLIGEIDYTHGELAISEALEYFPEAEVEVKTDLAKKQRILKITQRASLPK